MAFLKKESYITPFFQLKEVYLHIMEKGEVVESYIFKIKYNTSNASIKSNTVEHKESIVSILELFLELGNHEKLSRQAKIEMELSYYDSKYEYEVVFS